MYSPAFDLFRHSLLKSPSITKRGFMGLVVVVSRFPGFFGLVLLQVSFKHAPCFHSIVMRQLAVTFFLCLACVVLVDDQGLVALDDYGI
jgi:hypothetical protein